MKKMKAIFALTLLFSAGIRADDSETLAKLVALTERSVALQEKLEARLQRADAYIEMSMGLVQRIYVGLIPQIAKDLARMEDLQQQNAMKEIITAYGKLIGLTSDEIEQQLKTAVPQKSQENCVAMASFPTNDRVMQPAELSILLANISKQSFDATAQDAISVDQSVSVALTDLEVAAAFANTDANTVTINPVSDSSLEQLAATTSGTN